MKKKLTINSLALGNLKQRRKQYAIMIIGIILAMIFSSSTLLFMFSSSETYQEQEYKKYGYQFAIVYTNDNDEKFYRDALADGKISEYGLAHIIGYGYTNDNEADLGTSIAWLDDNAKELANHIFIEGDYPTLENEIAVEQTALLKLGYGLDTKVGDEITLKVKIQDGAKYYGEAEKTYVLSGILADKKSNIDGRWNRSGNTDNFDLATVPAAIVADGTQTEVGGREMLSAYVDIYNSKSYNSMSRFWNYLQENTDGYLEYNQGYGVDDRAFNGIIGSGEYMVFIAVTLILASCVAIVNAFNTNLKERKKQIGMLRAVGATKRQIIKIFGREALIISLISTPVSVAISYGIVKLLVTAISDEAIMTKSIWVLPVCAVVCVAVTMLAAFIPLISASAITPMQAIRNIDITRRMKVKKIKTQKQFSVPSHLARRSSALYKGGKIAVSILLTVMILFSFLSFTNYHSGKANLDSGFNYDYSIGDMGDWITLVGGMSEADKREIEAYPYFSSVKAKKQIHSILEVEDFNDYFDVLFPHYVWDKEPLTYENFREKAMTDEESEYIQRKEIFGNGNDIADLSIYSYENHVIKTIENLPMQGKIDYEKLASGEEIILVAPEKAQLAVKINDNGLGYRTNWNRRSYYGEIEKGYQVVCEGECPYSVGDTIKLNTLLPASSSDAYDELDPESYTVNEREVTIGAIITPKALDESGTKLYISEELAVLTTHAGMNFFNENARYLDVEMTVDGSLELDDDIDETITEFLLPYADKYSGWFFSNYSRNQENQEDLYSQLASTIAIVTIGFVVCASIVNNSLTATIRERKKEIGTLRAVGADISVFVKSYIRQLLSMFAYGYGIGFVLCAIVAIIFTVISKEDQNYGSSYEYIISPWETIAFCVILFAICSINLWSKVRKEMKNSIVENIKEL